MRSVLWVGLIIGALGVVGCSSQFNAVEKGVIEPKVDQAYDEALSRWCKGFPADVQARAIERGRIRARTLTDTCPTWRRLRDAMLGEVIDLGELRNVLPPQRSSDITP